MGILFPFTNAEKFCPFFSHAHILLNEQDLSYNFIVWQRKIMMFNTTYFIMLVLNRRVNNTVLAIKLFVPWIDIWKRNVCMLKKTDQWLRSDLWRHLMTIWDISRVFSFISSRFWQYPQCQGKSQEVNFHIFTLWIYMQCI